MDKLPQTSVVIALSQLVPNALNRGLYASPLNKVMPFLSLDRAAHKLGKGSYSSANRLIDLEWGEPRVTHVSRDSHHHTTVTSSSADTGSPAQNNDNNSDAKPEKPAMGRDGDATVKTRKSQLQDTKPGRLNLSGENFEKSIINRSLAYRPLFFQDRQPERQRQPASNENIAHNNNRRQPLPEILGMLNSGKHYRQHSAANRTPEYQNNIEHFGNLGVKPESLMSWSLPMPVQNGGAPGSETTFSDGEALPPAPFPGRRRGFSSIDTIANDYAIAHTSDAQFADAFSPGFDLTSPEGSTGMPQGHLPGRQNDFAMKYTDSVSMMPSRLPNLKSQGPTPVRQVDSRTIITDSFVTRIDNLIEIQVQKLTVANKGEKINIDDVRRELRSKLRPESIVTEQMIKVLLGKLQKTMREERFRIGLMS